MNAYIHTTKTLADEFDIDRKTLRKRAKALGLGIDFGGRAGFRYNDEDKRRLIDSLRPALPVTKQRKRTRRAA